MANKKIINKKMFPGAVNLTLPHLILFMFLGCTATPTRFMGEMASYKRTFSAGYDAVWTATMDALEGVHVKKADKETGKIVTEWVEGQPIQKGTGLVIDTYWIERYRFIISVSRESEKFTQVNVLSMVQEKTKGGTRSLRWVQKKSSGVYEEELLDEIERILANQ